MTNISSSYTQNPTNFLTSQAIVEHESLLMHEFEPVGTIEKFSLEDYQHGAGPAARLKYIQPESNITPRIEAYWLPWQEGTTTSITLKKAADHFFTSALEGCQLRITNEHQPKIYHVAGNMNLNDDDHTGSQWREQQVSRSMNAIDIANSIVVTPTRYTPNGVFDQNTTNVVGFRQNSQWHFYQQQFDSEHLNSITVTHLLSTPQIAPRISEGCCAVT